MKEKGNGMKWCEYCKRLVAPKRVFNWDWVILLIFSCTGGILIFFLFPFLAAPKLGGISGTIGVLWFIFVIGCGILGAVGLPLSLLKLIFFPTRACPICNAVIQSPKEIQKAEPIKQEIGPYSKRLSWGIVGLFIPFVAPVALTQSILALKNNTLYSYGRKKSIVSLVLGIMGILWPMFLAVLYWQGVL